jgi:SAM-dependent methyltransferase
MASFKEGGFMSDRSDRQRSFNASYDGTPPWDIGRPQPEFIALEAEGGVGASVLDVGCGTGEHALFFAERGHEVLGLDSAPAAIAKARLKAEHRASSARFIVGDALDLSALDETFDTVVDCGFFHVLDDDERVRFARSIHEVLTPGGVYSMLVFSDREPPGYGPRRVTRGEIVDTFSQGFTVEAIRPAAFETLLPTGDVAGWLARIRRD